MPKGWFSGHKKRILWLQKEDKLHLQFQVHVSIWSLLESYAFKCVTKSMLFDKSLLWFESLEILKGNVSDNI